MAILELIHAYDAPTLVERALLLVQNQSSVARKSAGVPIGDSG